MSKKTNQPKEYLLVPISWVERLKELAETEGINAQHIKGYVASADVLIDNGQRISVEQMQALQQVVNDLEK